MRTGSGVVEFGLGVGPSMGPVIGTNVSEAKEWGQGVGPWSESWEWCLGMGPWSGAREWDHGVSPGIGTMG